MFAPGWAKLIELYVLDDNTSYLYQLQLDGEKVSDPMKNSSFSEQQVGGQWRGKQGNLIYQGGNMLFGPAGTSWTANEILVRVNRGGKVSSGNPGDSKKLGIIPLGNTVSVSRGEVLKVEVPIKFNMNANTDNPDPNPSAFAREAFLQIHDPSSNIGVGFSFVLIDSGGDAFDSISVNRDFVDWSEEASPDRIVYRGDKVEFDKPTNNIDVDEVQYILTSGKNTWTIASAPFDSTQSLTPGDRPQIQPGDLTFEL